MSKFLLKTYIIIFFLSITILHSRFFEYFWIDLWLWVNWNFEFTKSMIINIFVWILWLFYFVVNFRKKIIIPKILFFILILFFFSIISTSFFYTNILWNNIKWQWILFLLNLLIFFVILVNQTKKDRKKIFDYILLLSIIPLFFAIKEYFLPSFDYGNLQNRALWTFWHPNFLALFILVFIPRIIEKIKENKLFIIYLITFIFTLFLTKSFFGILIFFGFILYIIYKKRKFKNKKIIYFLIFLWIIFWLFIFYKFWLTTKLNSFVSRFFIWETTIKIIFSDWLNIIFWVWNDTLIYLFEKYKVSYLYLFENIWYSADRPHNLLLLIFYNFWILGLWFLIYFFVFLKKNFVKNSYFLWVIIFLFFCIFNFASVSTYFLLVLLLAIIFINNNYKKNYYIAKLFFIIISFFSIFISIIYFYEENKLYKNTNYKYQNKIIKKIINEDKEKQILNQEWNLTNKCEELLIFNNSVENYFYCWNIFYFSNREKSLEYYKLWLEKIPDMWDKSSPYYDNILVKNIFVYDRFISEKFSNIKQILKRKEINDDYLRD